MSRSLGILWLSLSALGGLLVFPAIPGYTLAVVIPIIFASIAYVSYKRPESKRIFLLLSVINLIAGIILYWMPHSYTGGLSGLGLFICFLIFVPSATFLWRIFKSEYGDESNKTIDN